MALTKSRALSEDIVQGIFLKIWLKRERLTSVERFDNYLFSTARNHIYDTIKKENRELRFRPQILAWMFALPRSRDGRFRKYLQFQPFG